MSETILQRLQTLAEPAYGDFHSRLMPTVERRLVLGVRMPHLRALAKELVGTAEGEAFLSHLPHQYYEENNLHAILTESTPNVHLCLRRLDAFLPWVDNWATCDLMRPKAFAAHRGEVEAHLPLWLASGHEYSVRFAVKTLMDFFLEDPFFRPLHFQWVTEACSGKYYVNTMVAWYFATALVKREGEALSWLRQRQLPAQVHNMAIRKAVESLRVPEERKAYLCTLRR
ncbi:MAG: DNA alkylation repair protein [Clostridia bacterium]|nr:DNA alkylation repair protein [Clostridia bacterium]